LANGKNSAHRKILVSNVGTREKLGARRGWRSIKTRRPQMLALQEKYYDLLKKLPYCLGSAESATADFSHAPLMVSFSSLQMC
jgi:hypothetical protein